MCFHLNNYQTVRQVMLCCCCIFVFKCLSSILFDTFNKSNNNFMTSKQPSTSHCTNTYDHDFDVNLNGSLTMVLYPIMLRKPANHISFATRSISTQLLSWFDNDELAVLPKKNH